MSFEEKFKNIITGAKKVSLQDAEKQVMRFNLAKSMQENPIKEVLRTQERISFASMVFLRPTLKYATISLSAFLVVCFVGAGISSAAEGSLPGDILYPVKTQVNEKVLGWLASSDEAKAKLYINLANKRLEEIEAVSSEGKLDDKTKKEVESVLSMTLDRAQKHIESTKQDESRAVDLSSALEGSLEAHTEIIDQLADADEKKNLIGIKETIAKKLATVKEKKTTAEERVLKNTEKIKKESNERVKSVKNKINEIKKKADDKKSNLSDDSKEKLNADISALDQIVLDSEDKIEREDYGSAFKSLQDAIKSTSEVKTNISARSKLKANLGLPTSRILENASPGNEIPMQLKP